MLATRPPARSSDQKESDREKIVHKTTGSKLQQVQQLKLTVGFTTRMKYIGDKKEK